MWVRFSVICLRCWNVLVSIEWWTEMEWSHTMASCRNFSPELSMKIICRSAGLVLPKNFLIYLYVSIGRAIRRSL